MKLDDLVREARKEEHQPDWQAIDAKLFSRVELERARTESPRTRSLGPWHAVAGTFAAAAAAVLLVHSSTTQGPEQAPIGESAATVNDRIQPPETAYFDQSGVQWMVAAGSSIRVAHAASPLVLSLERGSTEAQVTPVVSGEAFAVDIPASSGAIVRVAVHGTHLRVARDGDQVTIDLTEGVVSIGAPPRRGSLIGTLVTAPAHVSLDVKDLGSIKVDHTSLAVRTPEAVRAPQPMMAKNEPSALLLPVPADMPMALMPAVNSPTVSSSSSISISRSAPTLAHTLTAQGDVPADVVVDSGWLRTSSDVVGAIEACARVAPNTEFSTTLSMRIGDDGRVQAEPLPRFNPPLPPEARDCAASVIYKRVKMSPGEVTIHIEMKP